MDTTFIHRFIPAADVSTAPTLLLLHGTGGNENDLLNLGRSLFPQANLLSPRGKILENGMPRFFRRLAEGVFDEPDLINRTHELADFVAKAAESHGFDPGKVTALGYSNGANIAASLLLLRPEALSRAALLRAMVPLIPDQYPDLSGKKIFLASGSSDPILPIDNAKRLAKSMIDCGATLEFHEIPTGHGLTSSELDLVKQWLHS